MTARSRQPPRPTVQRCIDVAASYYGFSPDEIFKKRLSGEVMDFRNVTIYVARVLTRQSTTNLGRSFGGRGHTTILCALSRVSDRLSEFDKDIREIVALVLAPDADEAVAVDDSPSGSPPPLPKVIPSPLRQRPRPKAPPALLATRLPVKPQPRARRRMSAAQEAAHGAFMGDPPPGRSALDVGRSDG